jgi:hypothetical protein
MRTKGSVCKKNIEKLKTYLTKTKETIKKPKDGRNK